MSKSIEEKNIDEVDKNELQNPSDNFKNIKMKLNYIIDFEIIDAFKNILNIPRIDFINSVMVKIRSFLKNEFSVKTFDEEIFKKLLSKSRDKLEKKFDNHLQNLTSAWDNFQLVKKNINKKNELKDYYLTNYVYHCNFMSEFAIHNCEKNIFGKFIKVCDKSNEKNKNQTKYVICENCRKAYFIEHFLNFCEKCQLNYYSSELHSDVKDILPATLKDPHCEPVINEKLYCQYCKHTLYLNLSTNQLKCLNCRFISNPKDIEWKCNICTKPFKSDIIVYNKSEVNYIKKIISYGLLIKKLARPMKLPCCRNIDLKTSTFYHKKECKGTIYFAEFHSKLIIICEKCKAVNNFRKFIWTCPECSLRFKDTKCEENELKLRKEIFNTKDIKLNNKFKKGITAENINNNYIKLTMNENGNENTEKKSKSKKKKNLYDILRKRTNYMSESNQLDKNNTQLHPEGKNFKEIKDLSTEGSDSKNINSINPEFNNDKAILNFIKVKKNNFIPSTKNNSRKKDKNVNSNVKNKNKEDISLEKKHLKKRYIFEKLIRKQFISVNNLIGNNINEVNHSEKNIREKIEYISNKNKLKMLELEGDKRNITNSNDSKYSKMQNSQSNSDYKKIPISFRYKKLNKGSNLYSSQNIISTHKDEDQLFTDQKSIDIIKKLCKENKENEKDISEKMNLKTSNKNKEDNNDKNNNKITEQESSNILQTEQKINVKRHLFKVDNNKNKLEGNKNNNKNSENDNKEKEKEKEKENKLNRVFSLRESKLYRKLTVNENKVNSKMSENVASDNENKIEKQHEIINHCVINNIGLRKLYKESYNRRSQKEIIIPRGYNQSNLKSSLAKENEKNINDKTFKSNNNNFKNNRKLADNLYSSTSMKMFKVKSCLRKKSNDEKKVFESNTYKNKFEVNEESNDGEISEEEDNTPNDIVMVYSIDKMETIPLNPSSFRNPLIYNNIQQRLKTLLFRGRLPLFNVDNYTIVKTLGEGTNGVIYQVVNNTTKKNYAMKKLIGSTITELEYLQKEFQICHQNPHPYILDIYGVCARCFDSTTYVLYVLMDLAEKDLDMEIADRFAIKNYYKESELISMMKKLVSALFYLQKERNVAHRDIKPENILIFKKGKVLKLADFGEAKLNNENKKKKTIRGTEYYMSPILYEGNLKAKYDIQHNPFKSDVFSLGYCFVLASALDPDIINEIRKITEREKAEQLFNKYFPKIYSAKYIDLLLKMITIDENKRVDFIGLDKILQNF